MDVQHGDPVNQVDQPKTLRLIAHPRLSLDKDRVDMLLPAGQTLECYLRLVWKNLDGVHARVFIDGCLVDQAEWGTLIPQPAQVVTARAIPLGEGAGGKSAIRLVAMLGVVALSIFAPYLAPAGLGLLTTVNGVTMVSTLGMFASAAITIAGSLAISARIPPARPRLRDQRQVSHG